MPWDIAFSRPPLTTRPPLVRAFCSLGKAGYVDIFHNRSVSAEACLVACCNDPSCNAYTFTTYQPHGGPACPTGTHCCWRKHTEGNRPAPLIPKLNCTSGVLARTPPTPPTPSPYYTPALDFVSLIATRSDGNLRDPSAVVQDPVSAVLPRVQNFHSRMVLVPMQASTCLKSSLHVVQ
jgi:hypothetical protein